MKKEVKIFLASSITELQNERNELEVFIRNMSDMYEEQYGIKIKPVRCEQIDPYITERTQDIINRSLTESEMCVVLVYTRFGEFTKEEFNIALDMFKNSSEHLPKIYVYFKELEEDKQADDSVKSFMTELNDSLQHYYGIFKSIDTVKLRIALNFVAQKQNMAKVAINEGRVYIDGAELSSVNLSQVSEFSNNQDLAMLNEELRGIEPRYYELLAEYKKGNEAVYEEYTKLALKRTGIKKEIEAIEREIFDFSLKLSTDEVKGSLTERQRMAYRLFESGDYEGASAVLDEIEIENDYRARKAKIIAKREAELKQSAIIYISEMKTKIDILSLCKGGSKLDEIYSLYSKIIPEIEEMEVCLDVAYEYAKFLMDYKYYDSDNKYHKEALSLQLKLYDMYENNPSERTDEKMASLDLLTGKNYLYLGELDDALFYLQGAEKTYSRLAVLEPIRYNDCLVDVFNSLGRVYQNQKSYIEAEKYYLMPVRFYTENGRIKSPKFRKVVADNYILLNKEEYLKRALELYKELTGEGEGPYIDEQIECAIKIGGIILNSTTCYNDEIVNRAKNAFDEAISISQNNKGIDKAKYLERIADICQRIINDFRHSIYFIAPDYLQRVADLGISTLRELISIGDKEKIVNYYDSLSDLYDNSTSAFAHGFSGGEDGDSIIFKGEKRKAYKQELIKLKIDKYLFLVENSDTPQGKMPSLGQLFNELSYVIDKSNEELIFTQLDRIIHHLTKEAENSDSKKYSALCAYLNAYYLFSRYNIERGVYYFEQAKELYIGNENAQALSGLNGDMYEATIEIAKRLLDAKNAKKADECLCFAIRLFEKQEKGSSWELGCQCDKLIGLCHENALYDMEERWLREKISNPVFEKSRYDKIDLLTFYASRCRYNEGVALGEALLDGNDVFTIAKALHQCYKGINDKSKAEKIYLSYISENRENVFSDSSYSWSLLTGIREAGYGLYDFYMAEGEITRAREIILSEIDVINAFAHEENKNQLLKSAYVPLGNKLFDTGAYENAISYLTLAIDILDMGTKGLNEREAEEYNEKNAQDYIDIYLSLARAYKAIKNGEKYCACMEKCADFCWCAEKTEYIKNRIDEALKDLEGNISGNECAYALMLIIKADTYLDYDFMTSERGEIYEMAKEYVDKAYNLAVSLEDKMTIYFVVYDILLDYYEENDQQKYNNVLLLALEYVKELAKDSFKDNNKKLKELFERANIENEYWSFIKTIEPLNADIISEGLSIAYTKINWNEIDEAITIYKEAMDLVLNKPIEGISKRALGLIYLRLGEAYLKNEGFAESREYLIKALEFFDGIMEALSDEEKENAMLNVSTINHSLARLYLQEQENERAYECIKAHLEISEQLESSNSYYSYLYEKYEWAIELCLECQRDAVVGLCERYTQLISARSYDMDSYLFAIDALIEVENMPYAEKLSDTVYTKENERLKEKGIGYIDLYKERVEKLISRYEKCGNITKARRYKRQLDDLKL